MNDYINLIKINNGLAKKQSGLTLVELLLYMGLLSILLVVLTDLFVAVLAMRVDVESYSALEQDGRFLVLKLANDTYQADALVYPNAPGVSGNRLELQVGSDTYIYNVSAAGNLQLNNNFGINSLNTENTKVENFNITRMGNPSGKAVVRVQFRLLSQLEKESGQPDINEYDFFIGER